MRLWPFRKAPEQQTTDKPKATVTVMSRPQYWTPYANAAGYLSQPDSFVVLDTLRRALPVFDAAVEVLIRLIGKVEVKWESERIQAEWDAWAEMVRVFPLNNGFHSWLSGHIKRTLHYGYGVSEVVIDGTGRDLAGMQYVAPSTVYFRTDASDPLNVQILQKQSSNPEMVVLDPAFLAINVNNPEDDSPYGRSLFARCPFIAELLLEIAHAQKQDWNRVGAPSFAVTVEVPEGMEAGADVNALMSALLDSIETAWTDSMASRKEYGRIKDFFGAGKINVATVGADGKRLESEVPWRAAMEQVIAACHLPPWLLGFHWSTTERLSEEQQTSLEDLIADYQSEYTSAVRFVAGWWARLRGYATAPYGVEWPETSLRDKVEAARAELIHAQAASTNEKTARAIWEAGVYDQAAYARDVTGEEEPAIATPMDAPPAPAPAGNTLGLTLAAKRSCACGAHKGDGQVEQPSDRRVSRAIERFYSAARTAAQQLRADVWQILDLPDPDETQRAVEPFEYTSEQEALLDAAVEQFLARMAGSERSRIGFINAESGDGIIQEHDVFAYQVGVERAAEMVGGDVLSLTDRNSAAVQALLEHAFDRLSENGQMRLEGILPEIKDRLNEAVAAGENPLGVARDLSSQFDAYEGWQFERLARTEVAFAQVEGQIAEFKEQGVDTSGVGGDLPPFHPNCLCDTTIEQQEDGSWKAVYEVATEACDLCQEYAGR